MSFIWQMRLNVPEACLPALAASAQSGTRNVRTSIGQLKDEATENAVEVRVEDETVWLTQKLCPKPGGPPAV